MIASMILRSGIHGDLPIPLSLIERILLNKDGEAKHIDIEKLKEFVKSKIENPNDTNIMW